MRYSYNDNPQVFQEGNPIKITVVTIIEEIEVIENITKEYNMTWVYIVVGCVSPFALMPIVCLSKKCRKQRIVHSEAMKDRETGGFHSNMFKKRDLSE